MVTNQDQEIEENLNEIERLAAQRAKSNRLWKEVERRGLLDESVEKVNQKYKDVFGSDEEDENEPVFEEFEDLVQRTEASESIPSSSAQQPYSFDNFQSFDELRKTPEVATQSFMKSTYKQILSDTIRSENVLPDNFPSEWTEEQIKFINRGYFFADKKRMVELGVKPKEAALKSRFLEERAYQIFCGATRVSNVVKPEVMSMYKFKEAHQAEEYKELLMSTKKINSALLQEHREFRIKTLLEVKLIQKVSISVPTFIVKRTNDKKYRFSEAHFKILPVEDIIFLYSHFLNAIQRYHEDLVAFEAVKRYISSCIQYASLEDFQIGFEVIKRKINVPYPDQSLSSQDIEQLKIGQVIKKPSPGVVFINSQKMKIFIHFSEIAAYSDGTLEFCKNVLTCLKDDERDEKEKALFDYAITKIDKRLALREDIRKIRKAKNVKQSENIVRRKGGCWIKYAPSNILGPHNIPPPEYEENMVIPGDRPAGENWFWHPNKVRPHRRS